MSIDTQTQPEVDTKSGMKIKQRLQKEGYTHTENYKRDFLEILGKNTLTGNLDFINTIELERQDCHFNKTGIAQEPALPYTLSGFFQELPRFNDYAELGKNEYIVGIYGDVSSNYFQMDSKKDTVPLMSTQNLYLISNYLNIYLVINQYDLSETNFSKSFEERYRLRKCQAHEFHLFDSQIDIISSVFQKVNVELKNYQINRNPASSIHYGKTKFDSTKVLDYTLKHLSQSFTGFHQDILQVLNEHDQEWKNMEAHIEKVDQELVEKDSLVTSKNQEIQNLRDEKKLLTAQITLQDTKIEESLAKHETLIEKEAMVKKGLAEMKTKFQSFQKDFASQKSEMMGYHNSLQASQKDIETVKEYVSELEKKNQILSNQATFYLFLNIIGWGIISGASLTFYIM